MRWFRDLIAVLEAINNALERIAVALEGGQDRGKHQG